MAAKKPTLLSGGNPQIAKGSGNASVQSYISAMPEWKRAVGEQLDDLISVVVPNVTKAVKWNSPFYGMPGKGWFVSFHCFTKYVKVTFFNGASLKPLPPDASTQADVRYLNIYEGDELDEVQLKDWFEQASNLPGWVTGDIAG